MKEFVVYTVLRLLMLLAAFGMVAGIWGLVAGEVPVLWALLVAFVISGVLSYFVLDRYREAFARRVQDRAAKASGRLDEMRSREDEDRRT